MYAVKVAMQLNSQVASPGVFFFCFFFFSFFDVRTLQKIQENSDPVSLEERP